PSPSPAWSSSPPVTTDSPSNGSSWTPVPSPQPEPRKPEPRTSGNVLMSSGRKRTLERRDDPLGMKGGLLVAARRPWVMHLPGRERQQRGASNDRDDDNAAVNEQVAILAAVAASIAFGASDVIEQRATHTVTKRRLLDPRLFVDLLANRVWLVGI